jgi:alpha-glucosidase
MEFEHHAFDTHRVRLWGRRASVEISSPLPGVIRVRSSPSSAASSYGHPELPPKRSFAVIGGAPQPIEVVPGGEAVIVRAGKARLVLLRATGKWGFAHGEGRELAQCLETSGEHQPAFPVDTHRSRITLNAPAGEAYLGFGEKVGPLDKRGMRLVFWNTDNFPPHPETDPLYVSIPFFVALRDGVAWGMFLDEPWRSEVDVARDDAARLVWETWGPELDAYLIAGPTIEDVLSRYTELTGRPAMPPLFALGAQCSRWGYESAEDVRAVVRAHRAHRLPLDVAYVDIDHLDAYRAFEWDRSRFGDPVVLSADLAELGVKLVPIVDPGIKAEPGFSLYEEAKENRFLVRLDRGDPLVGEVWPDPAVFPDLTREEVQRWWGEKHAGFIDAGMAGFWIDMNEPACFSITEGRGVPAPHGRRAPSVGTVEGSTLPFDARHGDRRHLEVHNAYGLGMARATFDALLARRPSLRPFVLTRAGYAGVQRHAAVWTGDFGSHFSHLEASIPMLVGMGLSGLAFTGADVPGFLGRPTGELLVRWMQLATFYPLFRNHSARGTAAQEPWRFGEPYLSLARHALERRYRLLPLLYTLMRHAAETGMPPLRPLAVLDPSDNDCVRAFDQLLFGDDLLVAPVVRPGQTKRLAYLPRGSWLELPNLGAAGARIEGGRHVIAEAPFDVVPVWLRAGGAIPLTEPAQQTTTAHWSSLTWIIHASSAVRGRLYEDRGDGFEEGTWTTVEGARTGSSLVLTRTLAGPRAPGRERESVIVHGLDQVTSVSGARGHRHDGGALVIDVEGSWERLEIELE